MDTFNFIARKKRNKKKILSVVFILCTFNQICLSQDLQLIDSLQYQLQQHNLNALVAGRTNSDLSDTVEINILHPLALAYFSTNPEKANDFKNQSLNERNSEFIIHNQY